MMEVGSPTRRGSGGSRRTMNGLDVNSQYRHPAFPIPTVEEEGPKTANLTPIYVAVGLAGLGAGVYRHSNTAVAEPKEHLKVFNGEDWVDLMLANIEILSKNTKRFRVEFEDKEAVSGLPVACE
ncbi:uncharacterized protein N7515_008580 [Penicillium bovifimosum]|uniref:Uncharacterized protein n=1 Tax=Penicillium bovifimosum TaxID=126998 RepID=A0A9W9GPS3_9EURO|nr:uncharacterized protein N7515_008580 [Penicillium bovifimosum]KAJ5124755.1 hypothetical protein N7515_008580 [Penicillium bovifimosum]